MVAANVALEIVRISSFCGHLTRKGIDGWLNNVKQPVFSAPLF